MLVIFLKLKYFLLGFLLSISNSFCQTHFQGIIEYDTEIETKISAPENYLDSLYYNYGKSLSIFYLKTGNFARKYNGSGEFGYHVVFYFAKQGNLLYIKKNSNKADTLSVRENSLKLVELKKVENEVIMKLDCDCYEFNTISKLGKSVILEYCFSIKTSRIDSKLFKLHKDFFISEFFSISNRPYLKYSMTTDKFKITYRAISLEEKSISLDDILKMH